MSTLWGCTALGASYYRKLFSGRSLAELENHQYVPGDGVFSISWLLPGEVREFRSDLESYDLDFRSSDDFVHGVWCIYESLKRAEKAKMILHYIGWHRYQPPEPFVDAVLTCPPQGSEAFFERMRAFRECVPHGRFPGWEQDPW